MTLIKKNRIFFAIVPVLMLLWLMVQANVYAEEVPEDQQPVIAEQEEENQKSQEKQLIGLENQGQDVESVSSISSHPITGPSNESSDISYQAHIQNIGWQEGKQDGQISGTTGQSKRVEAFRLQLVSQEFDGDIEYRSYVQDAGWENQWRSSNQISGTTGQSKYIEAIQVRLTGKMAMHYDVYYRVHIQNYGWLDWASNGLYAGSKGLNKRIEAMQIRLIEKGKASLKTDNENVGKDVQYCTHVQNYGWQAYLYDGQAAGTTGLSLRLEAIKCALSGQEYAGSILYRTHVQTYGWLSWVKNGKLSGTTGQSKRLEAIQIKLVGEIAEYYDVYYRVHAQNYGWMAWAKNGASSGTSGLSFRLEGIEIRLVQKGQAEPRSVNTISYVNKNTGYRNNAKVGAGWQRMNSSYYHTTSTGIIQKNTMVSDGDRQGYLNKNGKLIPSLNGIFMEGIDISEHNGYIDLSKYKNGFVIIRVSWDTVMDKMAIRNMDLCEKLGIPYGVYCYSYALTNAQARAEADYLLSIIKGRNIQVGVWYDMEDADNWKAKNNALTASKMTSFCNIFCARVESKGYFTGVYSSASWFTTYLSGLGNYAKWVAHWGVNDGTLNVNTSSMGILQQYTSIPLDRNVMYVPLNTFKRI